MKKPYPIPDNLILIGGRYRSESWSPSVKVGGKEIEARVEWLSKMSKDATLKEALEIYPANLHLEHADGGGAWATWDTSGTPYASYASSLDTTVGMYLEDGYDRVMKVTLNLRGLGIKSVDEIVGLDDIPRIDELDLSNNHLCDADVAALARMPWRDTILVLNLSSKYNQITAFPTDAFPVLEILWLGGSKFASIDVIEPSKSLEWLEVTLAGITTIMLDDIAKFPNLIELDIGSNKISEIPDLTSLKGQWREKLNIWQDNPLSMIVERRWARSCPMQITFILDIRGNPIKHVDPRTLAFFKAGIVDGSLKIYCDDAVLAMIENA
jgi:hypothetical protein